MPCNTPGGRGQLIGVDYFLPPCGMWVSNSNCLGLSRRYRYLLNHLTDSCLFFLTSLAVTVKTTSFSSAKMIHLTAKKIVR